MRVPKVDFDAVRKKARPFLAISVGVGAALFAMGADAETATAAATVVLLGSVASARGTKPQSTSSEPQLAGA